MTESTLERVRNKTDDCMNKLLFGSAIFWADKAASLSQYQVKDIYKLAKCMFFLGQYERAVILITKRQLHSVYSAFRYLAAKCYASSEEWQLAVEIIEDNSPAKEKVFLPRNDDDIPQDKEMEASLQLLKGDIYEAMDNREIASECFKAALRADVFCYEAFERLTGHHMLRAEEEQSLLDSLLLEEQADSLEEEQLLHFLYQSKLKKYNKPNRFEVPENADKLHENLDVATSLAERHYYNCEFRTSYRITEGILKTDPFHTSCLPLHVALLVELKLPNKLFYLAHKLVARFPKLPISWYAVGCYYHLQPKKQESARKYLMKTTTLDKMYGPAWLAYGHSFAAENEHDQAMAAYFTASQLMKGCHLPFLYIGLEYSVTNNTKLAEKFFQTALDICPDDPHVLHEMGVAMYTNKEYAEALKYFNKALKQVQSLGEEVLIEEWEPLLNNLGHVHRQLLNYSEALDYHRRALALIPQSAETYCAIGFIYSYTGQYLEAVEYLHKSLGLRHDDAFTSCLLDIVVDQYARSEDPFLFTDDDRIPDSPPLFTPPFQTTNPASGPLSSCFLPSSSDAVTPQFSLLPRFKSSRMDLSSASDFSEIHQTLGTPFSGVTALSSLRKGRDSVPWHDDSDMSDHYPCSGARRTSSSSSTLQTTSTLNETGEDKAMSPLEGDGVLFITDDDMELEEDSD